jgi:Family of unknown function (DUF5985)
MAVSVYVLCLLTSAFCAALLWREYLRTKARLLLWSGLSFVAWAANNAMVCADLVILPSVDLSLVRAILALVAITLLLYGLIGEAA